MPSINDFQRIDKLFPKIAAAAPIISQGCQSRYNTKTTRIITVAGLYTPKRNNILCRNAVLLCRCIQQFTVFFIQSAPLRHARIINYAFLIFGEGHCAFGLFTIQLYNTWNGLHPSHCLIYRFFRNAFTRGILFKFDNPSIKFIIGMRHNRR